MSAAIACVIGTACLVAVVKALLKGRSNPSKTRLAFLRAWLRLISTGLFVRAKRRFLKKHPEEADVVDKIEHKFHEELGLPAGRLPKAKSAAADATLHAIDRPAS